MIRAFLFDIGNVIVRFDFARALRAVASLSDVPDEASVLARIDAVKLVYEDGGMSRDAFLEQAFCLLKYRGTREEFIAAWQGIFWPNEPMHALIRSLHGRFPIHLLSNTNDMHVEGLLRDFEVFKCVTTGVYSHEVQASKPHPRIYEIACKQCGIEPASTFFIDDLSANIDAARKLGFVAHHYHHERHDALLADIRANGVEPFPGT
jgi:glucose-1-phosphatase